MKTEIYYGKADVATYRTYGTPLDGLPEVPESTFVGRSNVLMAASIEVQVLGTVFLDAYTKGDNRLVVATDTMKNFIHRESLAFDGSTLEQWITFVGRRFLEHYPHMERLRVRGTEIPFEPAVVPDEHEEDEYEESDRLFERQHGDRSNAEVELDRSADGSITLTSLRSGRQQLQMMKVTGSAFADFARDEYTTLPERKDRPLYIHFDVNWRYTNPAVGAGDDMARYVAGEQVADICATVFHQFVSLSIQHLLHEMGQRIMERYPQLSEVSFEGQNRLWDLAVSSDSDPRVKVYWDPHPPYGKIGLVLRRD